MASETRQRLIDISKQLMMAKGYNATTVEEICKTAEVTKGAFFHYFKTKEALGISVLEDYWQERQRKFAESNWQEAAHPIEQITCFLNVVADVFMRDPNGYACLAGSFTQELATVNLTFRDAVAELFIQWAEQIKPILLAANPQINADDLADYIISVIEGALVLAQARQNPNIIARQINTLNAHLKAVLAP